MDSEGTVEDLLSQVASIAPIKVGDTVVLWVPDSLIFRGDVVPQDIKAMHLFEPRHFIMPFLAHAIGTLAGALVAYLIAATYRSQLAFVIGAVFFCGGVAASFMIPAPAWFIALDLLVAYIPMAWLSIQIGVRITGEADRNF